MCATQQLYARLVELVGNLQLVVTELALVLQMLCARTGKDQQQLNNS